MKRIIVLVSDKGYENIISACCQTCIIGNVFITNKHVYLTCLGFKLTENCTICIRVFLNRKGTIFSVLGKSNIRVIAEFVECETVIGIFYLVCNGISRICLYTVNRKSKS